MRVIKPEMITMLKGWEMCMLTAYRDGDTWSIGYGHSGHAGLPEVDEHMVLADEEAAHKILMRDLYEHYAPQLDAMCGADKVDLTDWEWNACLDVLFNRGAGRLRRSKAWDWLKHPDERLSRKEACAALVFSQVEGFDALNMAKDRKTGEMVVKLGLTLRRIDDASLFMHKG